MSKSLMQPQIYICIYVSIQNSKYTCSKSDLGIQCIVCAPIPRPLPVMRTVLSLGQDSCGGLLGPRLDYAMLVIILEMWWPLGTPRLIYEVSYVKGCNILSLKERAH